MTRLSPITIRIISAVIAAAVVVALLVYVFSGGGSKKVTAYFASGVGVYKGTPVKILGVQVGSVTSVKPSADSVRIEMTYDKKYSLPADPIAVVVANSLVSDRYIQLAPVYTGGPKFPDGGSIQMDKTASPAELDDIYAALNKLNTALGPNGANKNGALRTLLDVAAANLKGNGEAFGESITNLSKAAQTLSNGRNDLFGTVDNLQKFNDALKNSDASIRHFEDMLATVAGDLAGERQDLGAALHNLAISLHDVSNFVKQNATKFHQDFVGLENVTNILVKEKAALTETLAVAPVALSNITHAYQEATGTLGTRSNLGGLGDPTTQICGLLNGVASGGILGALIGNLLGTVPVAIRNFCKTHGGITGGSSTPNAGNITNALTNGLVGGGS